MGLGWRVLRRRVERVSGIGSMTAYLIGLIDLKLEQGQRCYAHTKQPSPGLISSFFRVVPKAKGLDVVDDLRALVVTGKCATLKLIAGRFAGRNVPRGVDNFLAHRGSRTRR
jgi:hypothetical protein